MSNNPADWVRNSRSFMNEVQVEGKKVTWTTQKEMVAGTISVIVLVAIIGLGLFAVDGILSWLTGLLW